MSTLVLVRHGESRWNVCHRFTGWVDVPLSESGILEAQQCALHCKQFEFNAAFTSRLERAHATLLMILAQQDRTGIVQHDHDPRYSKWVKASNHCGGNDIPVFQSDQLNERYYGTLQGMEKGTAERKFGKHQVLEWRRGYAERPPGGESLKDTFERMHPYYVRHIQSRLRKGETVLVSGHGNTLRSLIKFIEKISDQDIPLVDLPEAQPLVYTYARGRYERTAGHYEYDRPLR